MTLRFSTGLRDNMLGGTGLADALAYGAINIYSGPQPASADSAVSGTLLMTISSSGATFTPGATAAGLLFGAPSAGVVGKASAQTWSGAGLTAGTAGWFRFVGNATDAGSGSTALPRIDGSVATSGGDLNMVSTTIAVSTPEVITVFSITLPES